MLAGNIIKSMWLDNDTANKGFSVKSVAGSFILIEFQRIVPSDATN